MGDDVVPVFYMQPRWRELAGARREVIKRLSVIAGGSDIMASIMASMVYGRLLPTPIEVLEPAADYGNEISQAIRISILAEKPGS